MENTMKWATRILLLVVVLAGISTITEHYSNSIISTADNIGVVEAGIAVTAIAGHGWELPAGTGEGHMAFVDMTAAFAAIHNAESIVNEYAAKQHGYQQQQNGPVFGTIGG